jgi:hypothetical protein
LHSLNCDVFKQHKTSRIGVLLLTYLLFRSFDSNMAAAICSLYARMGFSVAAAQSMVDEQGLTLLDNIKVCNDQRVKSLCKVICCPGGRNANVAPGDPGAANLGIQVSLKAEFKIILGAYWLRHQDCVSRVPNPADVTLASVCALCEANLAYKDMSKVPTIDAKDWPKLLEAIETYLRSRPKGDSFSLCGAQRYSYSRS